MDYVIYDGDCGICTSIANWLEKKDKRGNLQTIPYQFANLDELSPGLSSEMTAESVYFIDGNTGRRYSESRAAFESIKRLSGILKFLGTILSNRFFAWLIKPVYRLIARNRTYISQKLGLTKCATNM